MLTNSIYKILYQNGQEEIFNVKAVERNELIQNTKDAVKKGNNVFITLMDKTSKKAKKLFLENLNYWD